MQITYNVMPDETFWHETLKAILGDKLIGVTCSGYRLLSITVKEPLTNGEIREILRALLKICPSKLEKV